MRSRILGTLVCFTILSGCSSLEWVENEILFQTEDGESFTHSAQLFGINVDREHYFIAKKRWPRAQGECLKRRALILAMNAPRATLARLDHGAGEQEELEIISVLLNKKTKARKVSQN